MRKQAKRIHQGAEQAVVGGLSGSTRKQSRPSPARMQMASAGDPASRTRAEIHAEEMAEEVKHYKSIQSEERDFFQSLCTMLTTDDAGNFRHKLIHFAPCGPAPACPPPSHS